MHVVIVGAGKVGSHLAKVLAAGGTDVALIEENEQRCELLADEMKVAGVRLILGDGDEPNILDEADIRGANSVVAVTGHDEDNLVVTLLGKREYGVPMTIARINNPANEWLFTETFGVDRSVSNTSMIVGMLDKCIESGECAL